MAVQLDKDPGQGGVELQEFDFVYDVYNNRIEKDVLLPGSSSAQRYAYDNYKPTGMGATGTSNSDIWADLDYTNVVQTRYVRGDAIDQLFARLDKNGVNYDAFFELTDRMDSVREVIDITGAVKDTITYDGFGNINLGTELNAAYRGRYTWNSREFDTETVLQYNRARYYDGKTGRWLSQDPLRFAAGDSNLYRYVNNRPTVRTDPSGLWHATEFYLFDDQENIDNLDAKLQGLAFRPLANFALKRIKDEFSRYPQKLGAEIPNSFIKTGEFSFTNHVVNTPQATVPAGGIKAAGRLFFAVFEVAKDNCEGDTLPPRLWVTESARKHLGADPFKYFFTPPTSPALGNGVQVKQLKNDANHFWVIFVDAPFGITFLKDGSYTLAGTRYDFFDTSFEGEIVQHLHISSVSGTSNGKVLDAATLQLARRIDSKGSFFERLFDDNLNWQHNASQPIVQNAQGNWVWNVQWNWGPGMFPGTVATPPRN